MLTGDAIIEAVRSEEIEIVPFLVDNVNPNSINVRLSNTLLRIKDAELDVRKHYDMEQIEIPDTGYQLRPDELYLGVTMEYTNGGPYIMEYDGRSTMGRYFLLSHLSAGFGDLGFKGHWTLEIKCMKPTRVYAGMAIGQVRFNVPVGKVGDKYGTKYAGEYCAFPLPKPARPLPNHDRFDPIAEREAHLAGPNFTRRSKF